MSNWGGHLGYADDDLEDEEEEAGFDWKNVGRDGLIFLIDCSEQMFEKEDDRSHFEMCIECAKSVLSNKIISSEKDLMGVVFFGTDKDKNNASFKYIYVLQELDQPSASRILELENFLKDGNDDFANKFGFSSNFSLSDALWTCSNMFSQCPHKVGHKRVLLFTNNDHPHENNVPFQRQAKQKAKDLHDIGIEIELMHLTRTDAKFRFTEFYQDIVHTSEDEDCILPDPSEKFEQLLGRVRAKEHKKRTMGRIPFSLGKGLELGVGVYNLVRQQNKPYPVKLYRQTNEPLKSKSKMYCEDTGELLMPSDIKKYQTYGGRNIVFEKDEVDQVKKFDDAGLVLMGFKPHSTLKKYFHVRPAHFLFPDETSVAGSGTLFNALLQRCAERNVVAVCRYIPRKNSPPKFVALVPQKEELDEHNTQVAPPGFHVIFLPFADDMRKLEFQQAPKANPDQIDKAKNLVKKLTFKFSPENFENPVLQTHFRNLEALALDRDAPDEITDHTAPNNEMIERRAGSLIREFRDAVYPEGYDPTAKPAARRKEGGGTIDVAQQAREGKLSKLTVSVLKEYCQKNGLSTAGKKADLVATIEGHLGV
ncbi:X-ray repair cross-complementing protein 5-like [Diadema antillarum]|uniref:X-ray repair cross-complementing protein 5-like n=1 Tax=Diadema antillarum TaxID=105358 RepID=UPI003A856781